MSLSHPTKLPSERKFGILFTLVFLGNAVYGIYKGTPQVNWLPWLGAGTLLSLITLVAPHLLVPFNKAWFYLGQLIGKIVSPIVLGIIFYGIITPVALLLRYIGRDELRLNRLPLKTYWVERTPPGPDIDSFNHLF
ncbi:MAG: SxtJ family membrane protein [Chlorobiaceae bacterium]